VYALSLLHALDALTRYILIELQHTIPLLPSSVIWKGPKAPLWIHRSLEDNKREANNFIVFEGVSKFEGF